MRLFRAELCRIAAFFDMHWIQQLQIENCQRTLLADRDRRELRICAWPPRAMLQRSVRRLCAIAHSGPLRSVRRAGSHCILRRLLLFESRRCSCRIQGAAGMQCRNAGIYCRAYHNRLRRHLRRAAPRLALALDSRNRLSGPAGSELTSSCPPRYKPHG